ncbi:hypothetical protein J4221_04950 [Candidatus Pacearchaeota archaeon]|nr:hypothetical protein [Candidatus Pacearchaeota archaeon]
MIQIHETHNKIIDIIRKRGPSLPMHVAKEINMSSLFISAFLAEMVSSRKIRISNLKVGGSPLYYLEGQEPALENFHNYLHPKESEALLSLKNNKVLKDNEQEPAIRVALRSIKDFAFSFSFNGEVYWRYFMLSEQDAINHLHSLKPVSVKPIDVVVENKELQDIENKKPVVTQEEIKKEKHKKKSIMKKETETLFQNPLIIKEEKQKKEKSKSAFVLNVIDFLNKNNFKIIEEKDCKAKEYRCIVEVKSQLGTIHFFTEARDKKTISDADIKKLLSDAQKIPLPALIIYPGEISKKAREYLIKYSSILKAKKIE